jgi:hypothetical protein
MIGTDKGAYQMRKAGKFLLLIGHFVHKWVKLTSCSRLSVR